nr:hypothetical protein [Iningainema tapete]
MVNCVTLLTQSKTYSIEGTLYRYRYEVGSIKHTAYIFTPLPRQRKTADLRLTRDKVLRKCYEVPSLYRQHNAVMTTEAIQQSLF